MQLLSTHFYKRKEEYNERYQTNRFLSDATVGRGLENYKIISRRSWGMKVNVLDESRENLPKSTAMVEQLFLMRFWCLHR